MALQLKRKKKQQEQLEEESVINQTLKDQINKQVKNSAIVQSDYQKRVLELQGTALSICKLIEIEKKKNTDLKIIIEHLSKKVNMDGVESLQDLVKRQHKLEYDYDQIVQKQNESHAQINELKERVNASRTQRVIYSGVFKNIEREIKEGEEEFKTLLIERFNAEKRKTEAELYYKKNKEDAMKRNLSAMKANMRSAKDLEERIASSRDISSISGNQQLKQSRWESIHSEVHQSGFKERKFTELQKGMYRPAEDVTGCELTLNKIKSDTGLDEKDIIYYLENIEKINEEMFRESNRLIDEIDLTEKKVAKMKNKKPRKTSSSSQIAYPEMETLKSLQALLQHQSKRSEDEQQEIVGFYKGQAFDEILELLKVNKDKADEYSELPQLFRQINQRISGYIMVKPSERESTVEKEELKQEMLADLIEHSDKNKECEKIMMQKEMEELCQRELNQAKQQNKKTQGRIYFKKKKQ